MLAERGYSMGVGPRAAPGHAGARRRSRSSATRRARSRVCWPRPGSTVHTGAQAEVLAQGRLRLAPGGEILEVERIVTLPRLAGPSVPGLPSDAEGFLVTDAHARVQDVRDVYAAGDVTAFGVKQGGIACQQADAAAADIAARAGAPLEPAPFTTGAARHAAHRALGPFPASRRGR